MSFGVIIGALISCLLILTIISAFLDMNFRSLLTINNLLQGMLSTVIEKLNTRIEITNVSIDPLDSSLLYANVTNEGSTSIPVKEFDEIDIIVVYVNSSNAKIITRLSYDPTGAGTDVWYVKRVLTNFREGEILNPMNFTSEEGLWDPCETLEIVMKLRYSLDASRGFIVVIALPNGIKDVYCS